MVGLLVAPSATPFTEAGMRAVLENPVPVIVAAAESAAEVEPLESCMRYQTVGLSAET